MSRDDMDPVIAALRDPAKPASWSLSQWDAGLRSARQADLLARLAQGLRARGLLQHVPAAPRAHLESALTLAAAQHTEVQREVAQVRAALAPMGLEPVLLKGAAYVVAALPAAAGRMFSDVDILVPKARITAVEAALMAHGWATTHHSSYDQRYYREWMHEIPPLIHIQRNTVLDVHHAILPETARITPDPSSLLADARPASGEPDAPHVLAPRDMVLHSMVHLFFNEEHSHALRDLSDLDLLLRHFGQDAGFWPALVARASQLNLAGVLHLGLRHAHQILATPVPAPALTDAARADPGSAFASALMDRLWRHALRTPPSDDARMSSRLPLLVLYVRAHALRMPPGLLARHLAKKMWMRLADADPAGEGQRP
jgi:Uncharacterised nucleotidyltransferase